MSIHPVIVAACPTLCRLAEGHTELSDYLEKLAIHLHVQMNVREQVTYYLTEIAAETPPKTVFLAHCEWTILLQFVDAVRYGVEGAN